jgi:hypothetical protein
MSKNLNADWIGWVQTNLQAGCDKDGIFKVLLDEGYCYSDISSCMAYQPSVPLSQLVNPFGPVSCRNPDPPVVTETVAIDRAQLWIPNAQRLQASAFEIHALPDFLSAAECRPLVDLIGSDKSAPPDESETALQGALQALQRRLCQLVGVETWCGQTLEPTYVYGIRSYHHQAVLKMHRDRLDTHIISAIINVSQRVNQDWPLCIEDNAYRSHELLLQPGDMVFYEGGRLLHGRPQPLDGQDYANIFCHFKPVNYAPCRWRGSDEAQVACN